MPPDAYVRCVAAKVECFHGLIHGLDDLSYVDQILFVPMLEATPRDLECEPPPSQGSLKPPPLPARAHRHSPRISGPARSGVATDAAPSFAAATAVPGAMVVLCLARRLRVLRQASYGSFSSSGSSHRPAFFRHPPLSPVPFPNLSVRVSPKLFSPKSPNA